LTSVEGFTSRPSSSGSRGYCSAKQQRIFSVEDGRNCRPSSRSNARVPSDGRSMSTTRRRDRDGECGLRIGEMQSKLRSSARRRVAVESAQRPSKRLSRSAQNANSRAHPWTLLRTIRTRRRQTSRAMNCLCDSCRYHSKGNTAGRTVVAVISSSASSRSASEVVHDDGDSRTVRRQLRSRSTQPGSGAAESGRRAMPCDVFGKSIAAAQPPFCEC